MSKNALLELERSWERDIETLRKCAEFFNDPKYKTYAEAAEFILRGCVRELRETRYRMKQEENLSASLAAGTPETQA